MAYKESSASAIGPFHQPSALGKGSIRIHCRDESGSLGNVVLKPKYATRWMLKVFFYDLRTFFVIIIGRMNLAYLMISMQIYTF